VRIAQERREQIIDDAPAPRVDFDRHRHARLQRNQPISDRDDFPVQRDTGGEARFTAARRIFVRAGIRSRGNRIG
jgi:hypothetical protein